jgi:hypothetical protein
MLRFAPERGVVMRYSLPSRFAATALTVAALSLAGAAQQTGRGRPSEQSSVDPILVGTIDVLNHQGPDDRGRPVDFLDLARYAKLKGMRGLVFGSHLDSTVVQASIARKEVPGLEVFGAIDLNWTQGGMNPTAVEHFAEVSLTGTGTEHYGRVVNMASEDTALRIQMDKTNRPPVYVARNGEVVPEAKAVIAMIKKHNLSMATGNNSGAEAILLIKEAIAQGVDPVRLSVTHANANPPGLTVDEMKTVASLGAFLEFSSQSQRALTPTAQTELDKRDDRLADLIKEVGPRHVIMETELGQVGYELHPDGLAAFVRNMRARGISAADTDLMTKENPARYLNLPVSAAAGSQ